MGFNETQQKYGKLDFGQKTYFLQYKHKLGRTEALEQVQYDVRDLTVGQM